MADYPESDSDQRVDRTALFDLVARIFVATGMSDVHARVLSDSLVQADCRGIHSHGVIRVPDYVGKLTREGVDPRGEPAVSSRRSGALVIDGANTMGQIGGDLAMAEAIAAARKSGIALAALNRSNHCGSLDWFTLKAARADMIGIAGSNALPTMAPIGGTDKIVGMNPISVAMPSTAEPFVLDLAFGATAHGKIRVYAQKGQPIPADWATDVNGVPTTDALAALDGLIQPAGGHKGIAMAMAVGMLSTLLSGAAYGTELGNMIDGPTAGADGQFFIAINVEAFTELTGFCSRVSQIRAQIQQGRRVSDVSPLLAPGDMETAFSAAYSKDGIRLPGATVSDVFAAAEQLKLQIDPGQLLINPG